MKFHVSLTSVGTLVFGIVLLWQLFIVAYLSQCNNKYHSASSSGSGIIASIGSFRLRAARNSNCRIISSYLPSLIRQPTVFIISETTSGGSNKYIREMTSILNAGGIQTVRLPNKDVYLFHEKKMMEGDFLIFQYIFNTDFTLEYIKDAVLRHKLRLIIPVHDRYFLGSPTDVDIGEWLHKADWGLTDIKRQLFQMAELIIFPSHHVMDFYEKFIHLNTMQVVPHIDIEAPDWNCIPKIIDGVLNIGVIHEVSPTKGQDLLHSVVEHFESNQIVGNQFIKSIRFYVYSTFQTNSSIAIERGWYQEKDIFAKLKQDRIHCLLFLNKHPETYSYALTKGLYAGLPILYSKMGAIAERIEIIQNNSSSTSKNWFVATNNDDLFEKMYVFINTIPKHLTDPSRQECSYLSGEKIPLKVPGIYDKLFYPNKKDVMRYVENVHCNSAADYEVIHQNKIQPFAIFFPQFHACVENDKNFFPGYTDMVNLLNAKRSDNTLWTPLKNVLGFYDLMKDDTIIPRQMLLAKSFGFAGFGVYYYWFSTNTVSNKHQVFEEVTKKFFSTSIENFSVFFIYCNEDWTSNVAFESGTSNNTIANVYNEENFVMNFENLGKYFMHPNYKKIDNKPVFLLHHPDKLTEKEIKLMYTVGTRVAKELGFDGIQFALNDRQDLDLFQQYILHPQYKTEHAIDFTETATRPMRLNYKKYVRHYLDRRLSNGDTADVINSAFVNFDNSVRFFTHDDSHVFGSLGNKSMFITRTNNNGIELFKEFLDKQFELYKENNKEKEFQKIFLINAWNEWGEQMVLEPSQELKFSYLESFRNRLLCNFQHVC